MDIDFIQNNNNNNNEKEKIIFTKEEVKEKFHLSDNQLEHFKKTKKALENKGIYLSKYGQGKQAIYILDKILTIPHQIGEGITINNIQWPEIEIGFAKNLYGKKFGKLTPLYRTIDFIYNSKTGRRPNEVQWVCQCDCGNYCIVKANAMQSGNTISCGCLWDAHDWHTSNFKDLTGQRFGKLIVVNYVGLSKRGSIWHCKCDCGNEKDIVSMELLKGDTSSCGCIRRSSGEVLINNILTQNNIIFKTEYTFKDLLSEYGYKLKYDFAIFNDNNNLLYIIEYDGKQHFEDIDFFGNNLKENQNRDKIKNEYCLTHNIPLYRIPYYDKLKIKTIQDILQEKYLIKNL